MWKTSVACGLLAFCSLAEVAQAADMPLFPQQAYDEAPAPQYEFGSGWYLRGDLTASDDREPDVLGSLGKARSDWGYGVGGGGGYQFNQYFRADITGDHLSTLKQVDTDYFGSGMTAKSNIRRWDGLVNGYFDLGCWAGITPYIGAGVGFASFQNDDTAIVNGSYSNINGKAQYTLAWAAMAGAAYHVTPNLLLDIGYRYLDLGTYHVPQPFVTATSNPKVEMTSHQVRVGFRYMLN